MPKAKASKTRPPSSSHPTKPKQPRPKTSKSRRKLNFNVSILELPPELLVLIFSAASDLQSLASLAFTNWYLYSTFKARRQAILETVARNCFSKKAFEVLNMWRLGPHGLSRFARRFFLQDILSLGTVQRTPPHLRFDPYDDLKTLSEDVGYLGFAELKRLSDDKKKVEGLVELWLKLLRSGDENHRAKTAKDTLVFSKTLEENMDTVYDTMLLARGIIYPGTSDEYMADIDAIYDIEFSIETSIFDVAVTTREAQQRVSELVDGIMGGYLPFHAPIVMRNILPPGRRSELLGPFYRFKCVTEGAESREEETTASTIVRTVHVPKHVYDDLWGWQQAWINRHDCEVVENITE